MWLIIYGTAGDGDTDDDIQVVLFIYLFYYLCLPASFHVPRFKYLWN